MKILCVSPTYWPAFEYGGPIQSLHLLNKGLVSNGAELTVFTTNKGQSSDTVVNKTTKVDGIDIIYFSYFKFLEFIGTTGWHFSLPLISELKNNLKQYNLVYILSVWNFPSAITAYYCKKYNIPYIISPRGQLYENVTNVKSWKKKPYYNLIGKKILKGATAIHYTSEDEYVDVHERLNLNCKPIILQNGINLNEYSDLPENGSLFEIYPHLKNKKILLYLGRLSWKKGINIIIKTLPKIIKKNKEIHLVIAGNDENNYKNELIKLINNLKLKYCDLSISKPKSTDFDDTYITFTGYMDNVLKKKAFVDSKIFLLTSYSENFGMSVIEAMVSGLPVIISENVAISDIIKENNAGLVVNNSDEMIAESIYELLNNCNLYNEIMINGQKLIQNEYNINKVSALFAEEIINILDIENKNYID